MMDADQRTAQAAELSQKAYEIASGLKSGGWESAQVLALVSIAKSLAVLAEQISSREPSS
jgi:hypothetical protein